MAYGFSGEDLELQRERRRVKFITFGLFLLLLLFFAACVIGVWYGSPYLKDYARQQEAVPIIARLEAYHKKHNAYPETLSAIGVEKKGGDLIRYQPEPGGSFLLSYDTASGATRTYHSATGKWE